MELRISREAVAIMISSPTIDKLRAMKLNTLAQEFESQLQNSEAYSQLGFEERFGLLVDAEWNKNK